MAIQAIIMAGGAGTRLQPLTCELPKPLAPLCGAPIMDYTLRLLNRHGYGRADVTLWYKPRAVEGCFGAGRHGISLSYIRETEPVGTAGSVLLAARQPRDTVLVLSGDGLTNADLTAALAFHRRRRAAATLVLTRVPIPLAYGVVVTEKDGRITRFIEKPDWSRVISSLVNTGIYFLEPEALALIPSDRPFDFGRELFPLMLEKGLPIYGYQSDAYWCDVGDPAAFLRAQGDLLAGRTGFSILRPGIKEAPGALISADSYVDPEAKIGCGASVTGSCVMAGAAVAAGAQLDGAILCPRSRAEQGASLQRGAVLGAGAAAGAFSVLRGQARVWPGIRLPDDGVTEGAVRQAEPIAIVMGRAAVLSPMQTALTAAAFLQREGSHLAVMHDGGGIANYHAALGALAGYGAESVSALGRGTLGMLSHAVCALGLRGGLLCREKELCLLDRRGLLLDAAASAALEAALRRQELPAARPHPGCLHSCAFAGNRYAQELSRQFFCAEGADISLRCADRFLDGLARSALALAGHRISDRSAVRLIISEDCARIALNGQEVSPLQRWLLLAHVLQTDGEAVYDTADLDTGRADILPCDGSEGCLRQMRLQQDGVAQALLLARLFSRETPEEALRSLPDLSRSRISMPCEAAQKGRVIEALLCDAAPRPQGGLAARRGDARAVITPDPALPLLHIAVSARSAETAGELCDFYAGKALQALRQDRQT